MKTFSSGADDKSPRWIDVNKLRRRTFGAALPEPERTRSSPRPRFSGPRVHAPRRGLYHANVLTRTGSPRSTAASSLPPPRALLPLIYLFLCFPFFLLFLLLSSNASTADKYFGFRGSSRFSLESRGWICKTVGAGRSDRLATKWHSITESLPLGGPGIPALGGLNAAPAKNCRS